MSGYLTAADIRRAMDDLWHKSLPRRPASADEEAERASEAIGAWNAAHPLPCGAVLFPLPPCPRDRFRFSGAVVGPADIAYFDPLQGPRPARCAREPHPDSPWHWRDGTWWR